MVIEQADIVDLSLDPANVRRHPQRNLDAIKASLRRFGQQKPIVIDQRGIVRAGNGTLEAAKALGWTKINVVRSSLSPVELSAYAIADNRAGELAEWDQQALAASLDALKQEGLEPLELGFDENVLDKLPASIDSIRADDDPGDGQTMVQDKWLVVVTCRDEADQESFLNEMNEAGRECRALVG